MIYLVRIENDIGHPLRGVFASVKLNLKLLYGMGTTDFSIEFNALNEFIFLLI